MKALLNKFILFIFLVSSILFGGLIVGPYSIRIYVSIFTLGYLVLSGYKFPLNKEVVYYSLFILFYWIALIINGEISELNFTKLVFGSFLICFISIYAIHNFVRTPETLHRVIFFLIILGIINGVLSTMQFHGNSEALALSMYLNPTEIALERLEGYTVFDSGLGRGVVGFFSAIHKNGYYAAAFAALSPYLHQYAKNKRHKVYALFIMLFLFYAVFLTQLRFVLILIFCFYLFYFYKYTKHFKKYLIVLFLILLLLLVANFSLDQESIGRASDFSDSSRLTILVLAMEFVANNIFFGGPYSFSRILEGNGFRVFSSHNFILNAFIYSGIIGAFFVIMVFFKMLAKAAKSIFNSKK